MITHAAFPKTLLYCFIGPLPRGVFLLLEGIMAEYRRLISYIYEYEGPEGRKNLLLQGPWIQIRKR